MRSTFDLMVQAGLGVDVILFNVVQWPKYKLEPPNLFYLVCPV